MTPKPVRAVKETLYPMCLNKDPIMKMFKKIPILHYFVMAVLVLVAGCGTQQKVSEPTADQAEEPTAIDKLESTARIIEAKKQEFLDNRAHALILYDEASKADPGNDAAWYGLAKLHVEEGFVEDAEEFALKAVNLDPQNKYYNLLLADIYFIQDKNEKGLQIQQKMVEEHTTDTNLKISLLSTLLYLQEYEKAIDVLDEIERTGGFNNELSLQKQRVLLEMGEVERAIEEARKLLTYFPNEVSYMEILGELYQEAGKDEEAYRVYQEMLEAQPENAMARLLLADYYRNKGDEEKSFEQLLKAFESPQMGLEGKASILATYYYLSEDDPSYLEPARKLARLMLDRHPDDARSNAIYGDFLYRDQKFDEALEHYYRAATNDPSEFGFWHQSLIITSQMEDFEAMAEISEEALEYFFEQPLLYFFNGLANYQLGNYEQAISILTSGKDYAFTDDELFGQFLTLLGDSHYQADNHSSSFQYYEEAITLDPDNAYALNNYSYYMSVINENLEKALEMSAKSLEIQPDNAAFLDTFGWIKYKMGDYKEARKWIEKSLEKAESKSAVVLEHFGDVLYQLGEKESALQYWEKALKAEEKTGEEGSEFLRKKIEDETLYE